tara:strand:- start:54 stop:179 length:126 start_codon:yes stop_codon:yes gene_type:complete
MREKFACQVCLIVMTTEVIEKEIENAQVALGIETSHEIDQY